MLRTPANAPPPRDRAAGHLPAATKAAAACKDCGAGNLTAAWGKYGYYWKCGACGANTAMPTTCSACGTVGERGRGVPIRKDGPEYFRVCDGCKVEERVWVERSRTS